ncbi:hypothetical protein U1Q18_031207, partial [Sarracenia purpurea var. burkii]
DIPSSSTPIYDIPPSTATPSFSSVPPSVDLSLILNKLEAIEASQAASQAAQSAFQAQMLNDLHFLKQADSWKAVALNNIQVFLQTNFGPQQLGPQFRPIAFPKFPPRPQGMSSQPPQASQAHSTPTVRPPQGVDGSAGTPVAQEQGTSAKTQGTATSIPAASAPAASVPFPAVQPATKAPAASTSAKPATPISEVLSSSIPAAKAQDTAAIPPAPAASSAVPSQQAAAQAHSSSSSAKQRTSTQQGASSHIDERLLSDRMAEIRKRAEQNVKAMFEAGNIKPLDPSLEPPPSKPASPRKTAPPSPVDHSDVEVISPHHFPTPI